MLRTLFLLLAFQRPAPDLNIEYAKVAETSLQMDVYRPAPATHPTAAVVVIHGGAWMAGKRQDMAAMANGLAAKGVLAATVSYRLAPQFKWPAMLDDVQTAVRYLRSNARKYNIDPDRIGAAGASAGGHLALFLGLRDTRDPKPTLYPAVSSRASVVFDMFGPTDMTLFPRSFDSICPLLLGKDRQNATAELKDSSPIQFVDKRSAPVFIYQGLADPLVDPKQSRLLEARYKALGLTVESAYIPGVGHEYKPGNAQCVDALARATRFLLKHLKA